MTRTELENVMDTIKNIDMFNALKNCYLMPTFRYVQTLEKMIEKCEEKAGK